MQHNGGMAVELICVILVAGGLVVSLGSVLVAGFLWFKRCMDERFDAIDERFDQSEEQFTSRRQGYGEIVKRPASARRERAYARLSFPPK